MEISNTTNPTDFYNWFALKSEISEIENKLKPLKDMEIKLRSKVFKHIFPNHIEGRVKYKLDDDYELEGELRIDRNVDEPELALYQNNSEFSSKIPFSKLIRSKYELNLKEYRKLSAEQLKIFDNVIISKPATPVLKIVKVTK